MEVCLGTINVIWIWWGDGVGECGRDELAGREEGDTHIYMVEDTS